MWNQQQPPPPIHQQPPQHHFNQNTNASLHPQPATSDAASFRAKDLSSWCEAFDKHELVDILVKISKSNTQFQSYLGHAFVTDIKWCKIRVTFTASSSMAGKPPTSTQIQQHFGQYGNIRLIECFPTINSALITYDNYTYAQSAVSVGMHDNVASTNYSATCCYEFEGSEQPQAAVNLGTAQRFNPNLNTPTSGMGGPLEQRRIFVSSLSYSTSDETLENVFSQYGELDDCTIVKDNMTQRSKGYGFVVFKSVSGSVNALKQPEKFIDGRRTRSWLAAQGNQFKNRQ
eukprot:248208_1